MTTPESISNLVKLMLSEPDTADIIKVHLANFGTLDLILLAHVDYEGQRYNLFCEVADGEILVDTEDVLHLIILQQVGEAGLIAVEDTNGLLATLMDEFYVILLAESEILDNDTTEVLEMGSAVVREDLPDGEVNPVLTEPDVPELKKAVDEVSGITGSTRSLEDLLGPDLGKFVPSLEKVEPIDPATLGGVRHAEKGVDSADSDNPYNDNDVL